MITANHSISGDTKKKKPHPFFSFIGRQIKQFVDIITMNAVHHTKFEHAYVLDVHFNKAQKTDGSSDSDSNVTAASAKRQRV